MRCDFAAPRYHQNKGAKMIRSSLGAKLLAIDNGFVNFLVFAFFACLVASPISYAADELTAEQVVGEPIYIVLDKEGNIVQEGTLVEGKVLPTDYCVVCVPPGSEAALVDKSGKKESLGGPIVYDTWVGERRAYGTKVDQVTEGTAALHSVIAIGGEAKYVGSPVLVEDGIPGAMNPCFNFVELTEDQLEDLAPPPMLGAGEGVETELDAPSRST